MNIHMEKREIYFDNAASTRAAEEVVEVMSKTMLLEYANPSAKHIKGMEAERYEKEAREIIAKSLRVSDKEIVFTSGGTESDNMALIGAAFANRRKGKHIISSGIEHAAVYETLGFLGEQGFEIDIVGVDKYGHIDIEELKSKLRQDTVLVSIMYVNNEIGAIEPIAEIGKVIKEFDKEIVFHVDAIQAYGKFKILPKQENIDLLSVSAHKFHGPKGVGFLYINKDIKIRPLIFGGGQQRGLRSGTLNTTGIAGMAKAIELAYGDFTKNVEYLRELKDYLIERLETSGLEDIKINSYKGGFSAPNIVSLSVKGIRAEVLLHTLEAEGIYVSSGSACSSHHPGISGTLKGIGLEREYLDSTIRISFGRYNRKEEIDVCIEALQKHIPLLRRFIRK